MNIGWATVCGGASALTTLREIKYEPGTKSLVANPVEELIGLRTSSLANITAPITIPAGTTSEVPGTKGVDAAASADVLVNFDLPADGSAAIFGVCVLVGPITNATTGEPLEQLQLQREVREGGPWRPEGLCGDSGNSSGIPVLANLSAVDENGARAGTVSIGGTNTMGGHPVFITVEKGISVFDIRVLVDRCIVEAFLMGGRHSFTSMGPQDVAERSKGAVPGVPGTAIMLMGHTDVTVNSVEVWEIGCGWTDPPYMGFGPTASAMEQSLQVEGRTVKYWG